MLSVRRYPFRDQAGMSFPGRNAGGTYQLVHGTANHVLGDNDGAGD
jgi:hypothetical protein